MNHRTPSGSEIVLTRGHLLTLVPGLVLAGAVLFLSGLSTGKRWAGSEAGDRQAVAEPRGAAGEQRASARSPRPDPEAASWRPEVEAAVGFGLRFDDSQPIPATPYGSLIYRTARRHSMNPRLVASVVWAESSFDPWAISTRGARGLMQVMPATGARFGVAADRLYDPAANLDAGVRYLSWLTDHFAGDFTRVVAAYNAGEQAVEKYDGIPPFRETRDFVRRVHSTFWLTDDESFEQARGR